MNEDNELCFEDQILYFIAEKPGCTWWDLVGNLNYKNPFLLMKLKKTIIMLQNMGWLKRKGQKPAKYYLTYEAKETYYQSLL